MRIGLVTREWPPEVYGGAGVHVEYLARELRRLIDVDVHCFGPARTDANGYSADPELVEANAALQTVSVDLRIATALAGVDLVHSHTWYANLAGHLGKLLHGIPHVMTVHSLEPLRPWKAEQLGGGYQLSSWAEKTAVLAADAVIAVSNGMAADVVATYPDLEPSKVHVVHNGIDADEYQPVEATEVLDRHGVDPSQPYALFVGRITRQKGLAHLLRAARDLPGQLVLCAGAPDTPEIAAEATALVAELQQTRAGVIWIQEMLPRQDVVQLLSHATVFVCPSVYEPLGIVNLEAMACGTAVVASAVGGIPEVVVDGETGLLVPYDEKDPASFERDLGARLSELLTDPSRAATMGRAGRERAVADFGWAAIARRTLELYEEVVSRKTRMSRPPLSS
ncbi:MAG: alpha-maltose-phosphate synthase [Actinomycetota bacterium]|jgi:starch synthase|nr:alpha-maltose-phosphate synthase [Actinomycetota bacterium]